MNKKRYSELMFLVVLVGILAIIAYAEFADQSISVISPTADTNYSGDLLLNVTLNNTYESNATNVTFFFILDETIIVYEITFENSTSNQTIFNTTIDTVVLFDGIYNLTVNATNGSKINIENSSIEEIQIDNTAPLVTINTPTNNTYLGSSTTSLVFNVTVTDSGSGVLTTIDIQNNSESNESASQVGTAAEREFNRTVDVTELAEGENTFTVVANDTITTANGGENSNNSETVVIILDTTVPTVDLISPANFTWTTDTTPSLTFNYTDDNSPNATCELVVDGVTVATNDSTLNNTGAGITLTSTALSLGDHNWTANCTDLGDNTAMSSVNYTIDVVEQPTLTAPSNNTFTNATTANFTFNYTSFSFGSEHSANNVFCELYITNSSGTLSTYSFNESTLSGTSTLIENNQSYGEGVSTWFTNCTFNSTDIVSDTYTLTLDSTVPTVDLISPANFTWTTDTTPSLTFNYTDDNSPNATCELVVDGVTVATNDSTLNNTGAGITLTSTALSLGDHNWTANCTDLGDNTAMSSVNYTIDVVEQPTLTAPSNNTFTNATTANFTFNYTSFSFGSEHSANNVFCELYITNSSGTLSTYSFNESTLSGTSTLIENNQSYGEGVSTWFTNCTFNSTDIVSDTYTLTLDSTVPTVDLISPANWTWTDDTTPSLTFNYTDDNSPNATCDVFVDGATVATNTTVLNNTGAGILLTSTTLSAGNHTWGANCTDYTENNAMSSSNYTLEVLNVDVTAPANGTYVKDTSINSTSLSSSFTFSLSSWLLNHTKTSSQTASCELLITNSTGSYLANGVNTTTLNGTSTVLRNNQSLFPNVASISLGEANWTVNCTWNGSTIAVPTGFSTLYLDNVTTSVTVSSSSLTKTSAVLSATTSEAATCRYGTTDSWGSMIGFPTTGGTSHSATPDSLSSGTSYTYYVRCRDDALNEGSGSTSFITSTSSSGGGSGGSSGGSSGGVSGQSAKTVWTSINAGETANVPVSNGAIGFTNVQFDVGETVYGAWVSVAKVDSFPTTVKSFEKEIYRKIDVSKSTALKEEFISKGQIDFKVEKSWLTDKGLSKENVALFRYNNEVWNQLNTVLGTDDGQYIHFSAKTPGFSYFIIGERVTDNVAETAGQAAGTETAVEKPVPEVTGEEPVAKAEAPVRSQPVWPWAVLALIAIVAGVWYWMSKKK